MTYIRTTYETIMRQNSEVRRAGKKLRTTLGCGLTGKERDNSTIHIIFVKSLSEIA